MRHTLTRFSGEDIVVAICFLAALTLGTAIVAAWVLLLFGGFVAPVGVIHGVGVWFGVFGGG